MEVYESIYTWEVRHPKVEISMPKSTEIDEEEHSKKENQTYIEMKLLETNQSE